MKNIAKINYNSCILNINKIRLKNGPCPYVYDSNGNNFITSSCLLKHKCNFIHNKTSLEYIIWYKQFVRKNMNNLKRRNQKKENEKEKDEIELEEHKRLKKKELKKIKLENRKRKTLESKLKKILQYQLMKYKKNSENENKKIINNKQCELICKQNVILALLQFNSGISSYYNYITEVNKH
jgi:hypothetical protein